MKRRAVLAGIGTASIGDGAAFGSGAYSSIEADRDVTLNVDNDDNAQIIFKRNSDAVGAERLIGTDESNAVNVIEFSQSDLNEQSKTSFKQALVVENNTGENGDSLKVDLFVKEELNVGISDGGVLDFRIDDGNDSTVSVVGEGNKSRLDDTETEQIDIIVDLRDNGTNDGTNDLDDISQVTFIVEAVDGN
mgnify:FL=1